MTLEYNERTYVPNLNNVNNRKLYLTDITHEYSQRRLESIYMCPHVSNQDFSLVPS